MKINETCDSKQGGGAIKGNSMPSVHNFLHIGLKFLPNRFYGWGGGGGVMRHD